jgi:hypothetical protein
MTTSASPTPAARPLVSPALDGVIAASPIIAAALNPVAGAIAQALVSGLKAFRAAQQLPPEWTPSAQDWATFGALVSERDAAWYKTHQPDGAPAAAPANTSAG